MCIAHLPQQIAAKRFCHYHIGALSRYERSDLMSVKRRDNRNRILRNGESQRKDGRYMYKYIDNAGNVKYSFIYL